MNPIGLYIHVPFCLRKCPYCDFYSVKPSTHDLDNYVSKLCDEIENWGKKLNRKIDTVYFGGGTPSLLSVEHFRVIFSHIKENFELVKNSEITVEVNPTKCDEVDFESLKKLGVNRLSIGLQSANEKELKLLGRTHTAQMAKSTIKKAQYAEISNISVDLMLCTPGQTKESVLRSINFCNELNVQHISAYLLKIEKGTSFYKERQNLNLPDDEFQRELYLFVCENLEKIGFLQYEISNFSKEGFESHHNLKYWNADEYLGIGPGAHSFINGERFYYRRSLSEFLNFPEVIFDDCGGDMTEYAMLRLRLNSGLRQDEFYKRFKASIPSNYIKNAKLYEKFGFVKTNENGIKLTKEGFFVSNKLISEIIF